ncbi:Alcohol acetyltransferase domain containing protein [Naviculisporaceae sp. PSN 640]
MCNRCMTQHLRSGSQPRDATECVMDYDCKDNYSNWLWTYFFNVVKPPRAGRHRYRRLKAIIPDVNIHKNAKCYRTAAAQLSGLGKLQRQQMTIETEDREETKPGQVAIPDRAPRTLNATLASWFGFRIWDSRLPGAVRLRTSAIRAARIWNPEHGLIEGWSNAFGIKTGDGGPPEVGPIVSTVTIMVVSESDLTFCSERFNAALMDMHLYDNTIVACHYTIPPNLADPQHQDTLSRTWEAAVAKVVLAHPLLQAGIRKIKGKKPSFIRVDAIDLSKHIEWRMIDPKTEDYGAVRNKIYTEELCRKYEDVESQPGWRMVILRGLAPNDMEVMFGFHHTLIDGMSAKIFHEDLVKALNSNPDPQGKLVQNHAFRTTATPFNTPPPQDTAVPFKNTPGNIASTLFYELTPQKVLTTLSASTRNFARRYKGWPPITPLDPKTMRPVTAPIKTHFATFSVEKDVLANILANCRAEKITFTALLQVCVLVALVKEVDGSQTGSILRGGTVIDMRRYIKPNTKDMSHPLRDPSRMIVNIVTRMAHSFGQAEDEGDLLDRIRELNSSDDLSANWTELSKVIWTLSKRFRSEIQARLDLGAKNDTAGLMGFVPDWRQYLKETIAKPRYCTWIVSNIGVLEGGGGSETGSAGQNGQEEKRWSIRKAYFAASAEVTNGALAVTSVTVRGGELSVDFTWEVGVIEDRVGEEIARGVERLLRQVAGEVRLSCSAHQAPKKSRAGTKEL